MRLLSMLLVTACLIPAQLFSQPVDTKRTYGSPVTFKIYMGKSDQGTETYKIAKSENRYVLTSTVHVRKYGEPIFSEQKQELAADWSLLHYSFKTKMAKEQRMSEASMGKGKIEMRSDYGSEVKSKTVDLRSPALVFDSIVPSQFQVLVKEYIAFNVQQPVEFQMLMPQVTAEFTGTLSQSGADKGMLNDHALDLRKYTLRSRGQQLDIWADSKGELMRVSLPAKRTEFVRSGFKMAGLIEPAPEKSVKPKSAVMLH